MGPQQRLQVLIIGAGPTGMTAALELSRLGIAVRIVERMAEPSTTSRALGVQARTLELFAQRGLIDTMLEKGNRGAAGSIYDEGRRIFRLEFAHNGSEYGYMLFLSQAETEATLRDALERQGVFIERSVQLVALGQSEHEDFVTAALKHADGSLEEVQAAYLIDAEGAHSICRETLNLPFRGKTREESYALADLYVDGDLPGSDFHIFSSEHGFMGLFPMGEGHFRLIASNPLSLPGKDTAPSLDEIQRIYDQRSHIPARFRDMSWSSWFRINSRMVDRLQVGRVFLGGDSAHIHSPAGAQGMNTGIQDMINLSWKLAYVLQGRADSRLLETYGHDRLPVIHDVLTKTEGLTNAIGSESALFRSVFSHIAPWIVGTDLVQQNAAKRMSQLSLDYRRSPLSLTHHAPGALHAGDRVPNLRVTLVDACDTALAKVTSEKLFHLLSPDCFTLLFTNPADAQVARAAETALAPWKELLITRSVCPETGAEANQEFQAVFGTGPAIVLVRPDGYAAFVGWESSLDELARYLDQWFPSQQQQPEEALRA